MEDPLPPMPQGGYYVVEVTAGFVNNAIINNTLDLTGKSSTGIVFNGEDYGTTIVGNHFIGGTTYNKVYTGTAISLGATINSAPSGSGAFPLPAGWTALPNLGAVIEGNTIQDSLGGIMIGVQHSVNYWGAQVGTTSRPGRVFMTATVTGNIFDFDSAFLSSWAVNYVADGNNPAESSTPPTITIGSGFSAEAPGPYGSPRFPWTVGNAIRVNGTDVPIFVDPTENVVTVESNSVEPHRSRRNDHAAERVVGAGLRGHRQRCERRTRQCQETYNNQPYYPFNLDNLDVSTAPPHRLRLHSAATTSATPTPTPPTPARPPPTRHRFLSPPQSPTGVIAGLIGLNAIGVSWNASAGASSYVVERSLDATRGR